ncbi:hypothetical protein LEO81_14620 [Aeromonas dhakensis]|uniref:hypothetical protein n=1 Tax=Aeromonas dhakensis TaxID=196024 RepID=UPI001CF0D114|nr:hypothetical protein [Aeromonas dhakensis]UCM52067.1 hypothetical protein LEO81_14620 [Aeromonas dhakensis]
MPTLAITDEEAKRIRSSIRGKAELYGRHCYRFSAAFYLITVMPMHFSDFSDNEEPAFDVFHACHEIVFTGSDGNTEYLE